MTLFRVSPLLQEDQARWHELARGYMAFYQSPRQDEEYEVLWSRIMSGEIGSAAARIEGRLIGFAHYFFHASSWSRDVCYLQDLFVDTAWRGQGAGKALIAHVADEARLHGCPRLYWLTHRDNEDARRLYDSVAVHSGFIRYEKSL